MDNYNYRSQLSKNSFDFFLNFKKIFVNIFMSEYFLKIFYQKFLKTLPKITDSNGIHIYFYLYINTISTWIITIIHCNYLKISFHFFKF